MLRPAGDADVENMRAWRNQPVNREASIHQHEISADEHRAWWSRVQEDPTRQVLVFEYDGRPLGVVTFFDLDLDGPNAPAPGASTSTTRRPAPRARR